MNETHDVAIVGGGFAGTMVAVHLAGRCARPSIALFDAAGAFARGAAYDPASDRCLLNVRARAMGAFPGDEEHFLRWLRATGYGADDPQLGDRFLPRRLYGSYLTHLLDGARAASDLQTRTRRVIDIEPVGDAFVLTDAAGARTFARSVVLAIGNLPPGGLGDAALARAMSAHAVPAWSLLASGHVDPEARVLIVGTGLTALDVLLHLASGGHRGSIDMLSRHGRFPLPHAEPGATMPAPARFDGSPGEAMRALRRLAREARRARPHLACRRRRGAPARFVRLAAVVARGPRALPAARRTALGSAPAPRARIDAARSRRLARRRTVARARGFARIARARRHGRTRRERRRTADRRTRTLGRGSRRRLHGAAARLSPVRRTAGRGAVRARAGPARSARARLRRAARRANSSDERRGRRCTRSARRCAGRSSKAARFAKSARRLKPSRSRSRGSACRPRAPNCPAPDGPARNARVRSARP